jgi:hypothetical protein
MTCDCHRNSADELVADLTVENCAAKAREFIANDLPNMPYPAAEFAGRGVVTCAGGPKYTVPAWILVRALRHVGCALPVELWYRGEPEYMPAFVTLMEPLGVTWVDACRVAQAHQHRRLNGFEMKPFAIQWSRFQEVLFLDADNVTVADPTYLFDDPRYKSVGSIIWPDYHRLARTRKAWQIFDVPYRDEPEAESGQVLVDKSRAWQALCLAHWYGERSKFTWQHVYGDKELFHLCWRRLSNYVMPSRGIQTLRNERGQHRTMCQHDLDGRRVFQHHNTRKWSLGAFEHVPGFQLETEIRGWLDELRTVYSPAAQTPATLADQAAIAALAGQTLMYTRVGHGSREIVLASDGTFVKGGAKCERHWTIRDGRLLIAHEDGRLMMDLQPINNGWHGRWLHYERMPINVHPATSDRVPAQASVS